MKNGGFDHWPLVPFIRQAALHHKIIIPGMKALYF